MDKKPLKAASVWSQHKRFPEKKRLVGLLSIHAPPPQLAVN